MTHSSFSRRSFLKTVGAGLLSTPFLTSGLIAKSKRTYLRHASFGASGMAWADLTSLVATRKVELVAVAEVDLARTADLKKQFPQCRIYQDYRKLLEKEGPTLDSVNVSTPDHMHAPIALAAMAMGKHAYVQKPLAHEIAEIRAMSQMARRKKLVTQMGIQIHSTLPYRLGPLLIQAGTIGKIKEVHSWCPKTWGDPSSKPDRQDSVPPRLDWDSWLGVCADRPFIGDGYYHPGNWRKRLDFGTGTLGDMGCHIFDPVFKALQIAAPISVRSLGPAPNKWNWAVNSRVEYTFKGTKFTEGQTLKYTWYDGDQTPPKEILDLLEGDNAPNSGSIFVGTDGAMALPHFSRPLLYPDAKFKDFVMPRVEGEDHWNLWVEGCLGNEIPTANFNYSGPLTEAVLLGCIASHFPSTTLNWDSGAMRFDLTEANSHLHKPYRKGWEVPGMI